MAIAQTPDQLRLWYEVQGTGPQAVLVITGQPMSTHSWQDVIAQLLPGRRVIVYDQRGLGASDARFPSGFSTRAFAHDAVAVLDAAGMQDVAVLGHGIGGQVAQWLAADHAARVNTLVLASTSVGDLAGGVSRSHGAMRAVLTGTKQALLPLLVSPEWSAAHPRQAELLLPDPAGAAARRYHIGAEATHDATEGFGEITAPSTVLHGSDDQIVPAANATILADRLPGARTHVVPRGRHLLLHEFPRAVKVVIDALDEAARRQRGSWERR